MILKERKETVQLLILTELMINPECNQRDISRKLNLTPQAISEYFKELTAEGFVKVVHRGYYEITKKGEEWLTKNLLDLHFFSEEMLKKIYSKTIVAIASGDIEEGATVKYWFEDGFIFAKKDEKGSGIALTSAKDGEDLLLKPTGSFEAPQKGEVIVAKVPDVAEGGSRKVNIGMLSQLIRSRHRSIVVAIGVEALVSCRKARVEPIFFGAKDVCVEASHHGCGVIVVCTESRVNDLMRTLIEEGLKFEVKDF
ncbi:MAG: winged helix-turn-helix transcriptional regulator [Archaeoglobaceae archaeon]|nr:winged helix-turn-helix transcriptional regulator [Archaeoglobaceae archaeon]